nr:MAG TPA: hypothetical protein [Caudoviricetes sp.]
MRKRQDQAIQELNGLTAMGISAYPLLRFSPD